MNSEDRTLSSIEEEEAAVIAVEPEPDPVATALQRLDDRLAEHHRLIERQAAIASNLHAENQQLRAGELRQAQTALVVSVLRVLDDVGQMAQTAKVAESAVDLTMAADALTDALARNGIERVHVEPGAPFDPRAHKIAAVAETADPEADRTLGRVVRDGFAWADGMVIRVPEVEVLRHQTESQP